MTSPRTSHHPKTPLGFQIMIYGVAFNGLLLILGTLFDEFTLHPHLRVHVTSAILSLPIIAGLTLLYLSSLLARHKRTAWTVTMPVYTFVLGINTMQVLLLASSRNFALIGLVRNILLPLVIVLALLYYRREFNVKSDIEGFRQSLGFSVIVLAVAFVYGVAGFMLMDDHDFHREIGLGEAVHRTVDQFGLTTSTTLVPYTRRARIFTDSLSVVSVGAVAYAAISLFQPLRVRLSDQSENRKLMQRLLQHHPASSEDFFKLWPHDKLYFFTPEVTTGLALHVYHGVALVVGDPAGDPAHFPQLLEQFDQVCYGNDWRPAFIHTEPKFSELYSQAGFNLQKIGEEALLNIKHFDSHVRRNKYFRHIGNKFNGLGYSIELLEPPHSTELISQLRAISDDWLAQPGRAERGLMMGYFSAAYMQECKLMVARDKSGTVKAFLNQIPSFDAREANFDLLRHAHSSPGNINDFLLINFIAEAGRQGYTRVNMGLCPLAGMDKRSEDASLIDGALRFAYANGDRLYSFSGLHRFKAKYEPEWHDRYIVYRGGMRSFTRLLNALNQAMKVKGLSRAPRG